MAEEENKKRTETKENLVKHKEKEKDISTKAKKSSEKVEKKSIKDVDQKNVMNEKKNNKMETKKNEKLSSTKSLSSNADVKKTIDQNKPQEKQVNSDAEKKKKDNTVSSNKAKNDNRSGFSENLSKTQDQADFVEKLVSINRVAKVVKGGRRFSFAALVVVGDGNGMVGHGKGKAKEVPEAIKKATDEAKNNMIRVPLRQGRTLHHDIQGRFDSGNVYLRSAPSGTGVIAGGPMRAVFEALGVQDIVAKSVGTSNPHNMIRATFEALKSASSPKIIALRRGLKINDITKRRKITQSGEDAKN